MADLEVLVPITLFLMVFGSIAVIMYFLTQRAKAQAAGSGEYRKLAEETLRGQRALLEEMKHMNTSLKEIERLLREV